MLLWLARVTLLVQKFWYHRSLSCFVHTSFNDPLNSLKNPQQSIYQNHLKMGVNEKSPLSMFCRSRRKKVRSYGCWPIWFIIWENCIFSMSLEKRYPRNLDLINRCPPTNVSCKFFNKIILSKSEWMHWPHQQRLRDIWYYQMARPDPIE